ncbi:hypothetical protein [Planococcus halocryophilus]|nr:hypothetical protein [Planococcus halocryophilus]
MIKIGKEVEVKMAEKRLSQNQLEILKQIIDSEEKKASQESMSNQNIENHDSYEAFGRAIIEQIMNEGMKDVESFNGSTNEIVLDTQITLIPASAEDQEGWFSDTVGKVGGAVSGAAGAVGGAVSDATKTIDKIKDKIVDVIEDTVDDAGDLLDHPFVKKTTDLAINGVCVKMFGRKVCYNPLTGKPSLK